MSIELEAIAADLRRHLHGLIYGDLFEERYSKAGGCTGCFDAVRQYDEYIKDRVLLQHRPLGAPEPLGGDRPTAGKVTPKNAPKETL